MSDPNTEAEQQKRIENLRALLAASSAKAPGRPASAEQPKADAHHRTRNTLLGGAGAALVFLLSKFKFLGILAGVLKLKTLGTMLLSIGLYGLEWGWPFAVGIVLLIFVHELGHWIVLRREGIPAGAPVFIPFLGAFIAMRGQPRDAYVEAKVAIGGPILGSLGAWAVLAAGLVAQQPMLVTLGHAGIMLNLFNLIPVSPLDGGRIAGAFSRAFWIAGYALGVLAFVVTQSALLLIVLAVGLFTLWQRWRNPIPGYDAISGTQRLIIAAAYAVLVVALAITLPIGLETHPEAGPK